MSTGPVFTTGRVADRRGGRLAFAWAIGLGVVVAAGLFGRSESSPAAHAKAVRGAQDAKPSIAAVTPAAPDRTIVGTGTSEFTWPVTILVPAAASAGIATENLSIDGETVASAGRVEVRVFAGNGHLFAVRTAQIEPGSRGTQGGIVEFSASIELTSSRPLGAGTIRVMAFDHVGRVIGTATRAIVVARFREWVLLPLTGGDGLNVGGN